MNYRTLDIIDFESYDKIRTLALDTYPEAFLSSNTSERADRKNKYISTIENDFNFIMGAFDIDNLVGIVTFIRENREKSKHKGGIFAMFLKPEYQGKGIATKLLELTLDKAFQIEGLKQINLGVNYSNKNAIKLYEKLGFKIYGTEKDAMFVNNTYYDELLMVLFETNH